MSAGKKLLWAAKLAFGLALVAVLLLRADLAALGAELGQADPRWLLLMLALPHFGILLSAWKWQWLLAARGARVSIGRLYALYLIGTFFNSFLPSMMGGDVVRAFALGREGRQVELATAATFMERFTGFAALITLMPLALLQPQVIESAPATAWLVLAALAGYAVMLWLAFSSFPIAPRATGTAARLAGFVSRTREQVRSFRGHPGTLAACYAVSLVFYALAAVTVWLAARTVGASAPLDVLVSVQPSILFVGMIPVSVNGLGLLEAGYVVFLGAIGLAPAEALSVALLIRFRILLTSVLGGLVFLAYRRGIAPQGTAADPAGVPAEGERVRRTTA